MTQLILASGSPRRKDYLNYLSLPFSIVIPNVDESKKDCEKPQDLVLRLSKIKAHAVNEQYPNAVIVAADTVVAIEDKILGKPKDKGDAFQMLKTLQGKTHSVYTGTTIAKGKEAKSFVCKTEVTFAKLDDDLIKFYLSTNEWEGKAGGYALQGIAAMLIEKTNGSVSNVVGLPINEVRITLQEFGLKPKVIEKLK